MTSHLQTQTDEITTPTMGGHKSDNTTGPSTEGQCMAHVDRSCSLAHSRSFIHSFIIGPWADRSGAEGRTRRYAETGAEGEGEKG